MNGEKKTGKKMKGRVAAFLLALVLMLQILPAQAPSAKAESWMQPYLDKLVDWGVMRGDLSGNLEPDRNITRAEFVAMINRAYGYTKVVSTPFTDVYRRNWYFDDIGIAYGARYFNGTSATTASPEAYLTRQEAAVVMGRNMRLQEVTGEVVSFTDGRGFSDWSRGMIEACARHNVISGYPDGSFQPFNNITRGEMAALVARAVGTLVKTPGEQSLGSVYGNVTVSASGVTLKNTVIAGDLYLTGGIGLGSVTLDNVTVLGRIVISGAGESNRGDSSVIIRNTQANSLVVDSISSQFVTIRAEGDTTIDTTTVRTTAYIEDVTPSGIGLKNIEIDGAGGLNVQLAGNIKEVINFTPNSTLSIPQGRASVVTIDEAATNSVLNIELGAMISTLNLDTGAVVRGKGDIGHLNVNAPGCSVEMLPDTITIRPGITANIYGEEMDATGAIESSSDPRLLAGYPAMRNVAPTAADAVFSTNKKGTVYWALSSIADGSVNEEDLINPPVYGGIIIQSGHMEIPSSNTEVTIPLTGLVTDGSYYVSAVLVDNRGERSPVKVAAFTTPDNSVPRFTTEPEVNVNKKNEAWATIMPSKSCQLYYAVLPKGAVQPTIDEFKTGSVSGNSGYGVRPVTKNKSDTFQVNTSPLDELKEYVLYTLLIDADGGMNSGVQQKGFKTLDITPPRFLVNATPTSIKEKQITLTTTINEDGKIYWVVLPAGEEYPKAMPGQSGEVTLDSDTAKMQVEYGMGSGQIVTSNNVTAKENTSVTINITQNLEPATTYDFYYVAKDAAGNYSSAVEKTTINTLDNVAPTASQSFTRTIDEAGLQPLSSSDVEIIFSESVMDSTGLSGDSLMKLYEDKDSDAHATEMFASILEADIRLLNGNGDDENNSVTVKRTDTQSINGAWIDYRKAIVSMRDSKTVITFRNGVGINLASGGTYTFAIYNISDVSNNQNKMRPNPTRLTPFTVAFAQVTLSSGFSLRPEDTNINVDMEFTMTPLSTNSVEQGTAYDMFMWTDKMVGFNMYVRVLDSNGDPVGRSATGDNLEAMSMFQNSDAFKGTNGGIDKRGWFCIGEMFISGSSGNGRLGYSVNNLINKSGYNAAQSFPQLNSLNDKYTYEFAIEVTQVGTSKVRDEWSDNVNIWVTVPAGPESTIKRLSQEITQTNAISKWNAATVQNGEASSIGNNARTGRDDFSVSYQFVDSKEPTIAANYPYVEAGDQNAVIRLTLDRAGTVYYIVAPVGPVENETNKNRIPAFYTEYADSNAEKCDGIMRIDMLDNNEQHIRPDRDAIDESQKKVKVPTNFRVQEYVMTTQATDTNPVKFGTASVGISETQIPLSGLQKKTEYVVYLVTRGTSMAISPVHAFRFETTDVKTPTITLDANASTANVITSTDAVGGWITVPFNSLSNGVVNLNNPFLGYIDDTDPNAQTAYNTDLKNHNNSKALTIIDAMIKTIGDGRSFFDAYANTYIKQQVQDYIVGNSGTDVIAGKGTVESYASNVNGVNIDCSKKLDGSELDDGIYYYLILAMKNKLGEEYAFRAYYPVYKADTEAPYVISFTGDAKDANKGSVTGTSPGWQFGTENLENYLSYTYSGAVTILFNEPFRLLPTEGNDRTLITLNDITTHKNYIGNYILATNVTLSNYKVTSDSITFDFSGARRNSQIILFRGGLISDRSSNTIGEGTRMVLTFRNHINNTGVEVQAYFESNIPVGSN